LVLVWYISLVIVWCLARHTYVWWPRAAVAAVATCRLRRCRSSFLGLRKHLPRCRHYLLDLRKDPPNRAPAAAAAAARGRSPLAHSSCPAVFMTGTVIPVKLGRSGGVGTITRTDICNLPCPLPILLNHRRPHRDTQRTRIGRHAVAFAAGCTILWRPGVAASTPCAKA
jgi:hypothetical protein